jgi:hypothetical protein
MEPSVVPEVDSPVSAEQSARGGGRIIKSRIKCTIDVCRGVLVHGTLAHYPMRVGDEIMSHLMKGCGGACERLGCPSLITATC